MRYETHAVRAILFDLDGTLIDTLELILASMRHATQTVLGAALPDEVLMHNVGVPLIVQMREFDEVRADEMLLVYREHNALVHDDLVKQYPGVDDTLSQLASAGFRLGVVTSKARHVAEKGLSRFGLQHHFEVLVSYDDVPVHKPDPYPLTYAADRLGIPIASCAYVGDSPHDLAAARAAGCMSVAALWGVASETRLRAEAPDFVARSMEEVGRMFLNPDCLADGETTRPSGD